MSANNEEREEEEHKVVLRAGTAISTYNYCERL